MAWGTPSVLSSDDCASPLAAPHSIYSPELNPVERIWLYLRERYLSHRLLANYEAVVDGCCQAWNALTAEKGRIQSLTSYPYLNGVTS